MRLSAWDMPARILRFSASFSFCAATRSATMLLFAARSSSVTFAMRSSMRSRWAPNLAFVLAAPASDASSLAFRALIVLPHASWPGATAGAGVSVLGAGPAETDDRVSARGRAGVAMAVGTPCD